MKSLKQILSASRLSGLVGLAVILAGCRTAGPRPAAATSESAKMAAASGAQLWGQNCMRCHNVRSPSSYSDAEWEVAMHHMRIRANLRAEEHRKILEFLKSAN